MDFEVITLFPDFFHQFFRTSLFKRAVKSGIINYRLINLRNFGEGRYRKVDDYPFGGKQGSSPGMLLKETVLNRAYETTNAQSREDCHTIFFSPRGRPLTQQKVEAMGDHDNLILICGHYEGVDERFIRNKVDEEISIGDYVLSGGEPAALVFMDAVARQIPGFLGNPNSKESESYREFSSGMQLLEADQYTRPRSEEIPPVLLSGHEREIKRWAYRNALLNTFNRRPDLLDKAKLSYQDELILKEDVFSRKSPDF